MASSTSNGSSAKGEARVGHDSLRGLTTSGPYGINVARMTTSTPKARPHVLRVRVSDDERQWLETFAAADERSVHYVLRLALKEFWEAHRDDS